MLAANPIDDVDVALLPPPAPIALGPMVCPEATHDADAESTPPRVRIRELS